LIDFAEDEWAARHVAQANVLQLRFGPGAVAPTAFGNVAESMHGYAFSRYHLDLVTFWSRLQSLLQKQKDFFATLQDAKTQLDFLVASIFLSALTTLVWVVVLPVWSDAVGLFLMVALLGPLVTRLLYLTGVENYMAFADVVRTAVDLYRFDLFDALHVARPSGVRDERVLWEALQRISSLGQEEVELSYRARPVTEV
jgi:hypothetical protein